MISQAAQQPRNVQNKPTINVIIGRKSNSWTFKARDLSTSIYTTAIIAMLRFLGYLS